MPNPDPDVARRIAEAADRLLAGKPAVVPTGSLSVSMLAKEAGVARARLYDTYGDALAEFNARVEQHQVDPPAATPNEQALTERVVKLEEQVRDLKSRLAQANSEITIRKRANDQFMRIINLLERQKQVLEGKIESAHLKHERDARAIESLRGQALDPGDSSEPYGVTRLRPRSTPPEDR